MAFFPHMKISQFGYEIGRQIILHKANKYLFTNKQYIHFLTSDLN